MSTAPKEHDLHADMCSTASAEGRGGARMFRNTAIRLHVICYATCRRFSNFTGRFFAVLKNQVICARDAHIPNVDVVEEMKCGPKGLKPEYEGCVC